jgi:hypothetical protein
VNFRDHKADMSSPKNAEVYYDWGGGRILRRRSFGDFLLFSVDDKQSITTPNVADQALLETPERPDKIWSASGISAGASSAIRK